MNPLEIAHAIRNRPDDDEDLQAFVLRTMPKERMADFGPALNLLIGWERAYEELEKLFDALRGVAAKKPDAKINDLIVAKRRLGYDAAFEAVLARRWRCPHCKQFASVSNIELPIGDPERLPRCVTCGEEGIYPVEPKAKLDARDGGKSGLRPV